MLFANSLIQGFFESTIVGQVMVYIQLALSVWMVAVAIGKNFELRNKVAEINRFESDFLSYTDVLGYYINRRPAGLEGIECIYKNTCERLIKLAAPDMRAMLAGRTTDSRPQALTAVEIELVRSTTEHSLEEQLINAESKMWVFTAIVAVAPMIGLLGTVWGVLDAFAVMGREATANLATIAPSISSALVTTVVGLLVALPGIFIAHFLNQTLRKITAKYDSFAEEIISRIACEFQGRN